MDYVIITFIGILILIFSNKSVNKYKMLKKTKAQKYRKLEFRYLIAYSVLMLASTAFIVCFYIGKFQENYKVYDTIDDYAVVYKKCRDEIPGNCENKRFLIDRTGDVRSIEFDRIIGSNDQLYFMQVEDTIKVVTKDEPNKVVYEFISGSNNDIMLFDDYFLNGNIVMDYEGNIKGELSFLHDTSLSYMRKRLNQGQSDDQVSLFYNNYAVLSFGNRQYIVSEESFLTKRVYDYDEVEAVNDLDLLRVKKDEKYGYIDAEGNIVIDVIYDELSTSNNGLILARKDYHYGYLDSTGNIVVAFEYDHLENYNNGVAMAIKDDQYGYIDTEGNVVIDFIYDQLRENENGIVVANLNYQYGIISLDLEGDLITDFNYDYIGEYENGLALARKNGLYGYIDEDGNEVIEFKYSSLNSFNESVTVVYDTGRSRYGLINKEGDWIKDVNPPLDSNIRLNFKIVHDQTDSNLFYFTTSDMIMSNKGDVLLYNSRIQHLEHIDGHIFTYYVVNNKNDYDWFVNDLGGNILTKSKHGVTGVLEFNKNYLVEYKENNQVGLLALNGDQIVDATYDSIMQIEGLLVGVNTERVQFKNRRGNYYYNAYTIINPNKDWNISGDYDYIGYINNHEYIVNKEGSIKRFNDETGEIITLYQKPWTRSLYELVTIFN